VLKTVVEHLVTLIEAGGAFVIALGAVMAFVRFLAALVHRSSDPHRFVEVRLGLGRYLALGLEFQLAGDVLRTAIAPKLHELAVLAAVAAIRTALNFFLNREIREGQQQLTTAP
jgi:uncharacterized membrane protein